MPDCSRGHAEQTLGFDRAIIIDPSALPFTESVDSSDATTETAEPFDCAAQQQTIWYSLTPTGRRTYLADLAGSSPSRQRPRRLATDRSWPRWSDFRRMHAMLSECRDLCGRPTGETFAIVQAGDLFGGLGTLQVSLVTARPPPNDDFGDVTRPGYAGIDPGGRSGCADRRRRVAAHQLRPPYELVTACGRHPGFAAGECRTGCSGLSRRRPYAAPA